MLAWLPLAATLAFGQVAPASGKQLADLRVSMDHWVLVARPDAADPETKQLGQELQGLHARAIALDASDATAVKALQTDFDGWKERYARLSFDRRPPGAPNDEALHRRQLEAFISGLGKVQAGAKNADKQLGVLKHIVDPASFNLYVEGARAGVGSASVPGWGTAGAGRRPAGARATGGVPEGWTGPDGGSDVQLDAPPDPQVVSGVSKIGNRMWKNGGTVGSCYAGVKDILQNLGVVSSFWGKNGRDRDGRLVRVDENQGAYQFNKWVQDHPTLQNRKLLRIPEPAWPLRISDVVVWGRGVCGYNDDWGHIEMIYKLSQDKRQGWAVSDHSQEFNVDCFKRESARANAAREQLPQLRDAAAKAQQDASSAGSGRAKTAARRVLAQARAALAKAQAAAERVSVYLIERPQ